MNEIDMMKLAIRELEDAHRLKRVNEELYEQLTGSIQWLFSYSERNHIPLPKRESIVALVEKSSYLIDQFTYPTKTAVENPTITPIEAPRPITPRMKQNPNSSPTQNHSAICNCPARTPDVKGSMISVFSLRHKRQL